VYAGAAIVQRLAPFVALPVLARVMTKDQLALTAVSLAVANLGAFLLPLGLNVSITRLVYDDPPTAPRARWAGMFYAQIAASSAFAAVAVITVPLWLSSLALAQDAKSAVRLALVYALLVAVASTAQGILRASLQPNAFLSVAVAQVVVGTSVGITGAYVSGVFGYFTGLSAGAAAAAALGIWHTRRRPTLDVQSVRAAVRLSAPFVLHMGALWSLNLVDRLLVQHYLGPAATASYYIAYTIGTAPLLAFEAAQSAWAPRYFNSDPFAAEKLIQDATRWAAPIGAGVALTMALLSPLTLTLVAPALAEPVAAQTAAVVAAVALVRPRYLILIAMALQKKETGAIGVASTLAAVVNIVMNVLLLRHFGIVSAAAATVVGYGVQTAVLEGLSKPRPSLLGRDLFVMVLGAAAVSGLAASMAWAASKPVLAATAGVSLFFAVTCATRHRHRNPAKTGIVNALPPVEIATSVEQAE
jgi:O-antigen/teichoic acid export membrane protein